MKIPEDIRKCVGFLEYEDAEGHHASGTVFFVTMSTPDWPHYCFRYAVTAGHVIKEIEERLVGNCIFLRLNDRGSGIHRIPSWSDQWHLHPRADIAVMPIDSGESIDWMFWPVGAFALEKTIKEIEVSVGDDVFLAGLFHYHAGSKRNIPIIRAGIIAAMAEEPVKTKSGTAEAYLIEARSIGGLSGSPVFVRPESNYAHNLKTEDPNTLGWCDARVGSFWLLGLMHGHWDVGASEIDAVSNKGNAEKINTGIGVVIPAEKIFEVLELPELAEIRKQKEAELHAQCAATPDAS
jgi:hypothetical protein